MTALIRPCPASRTGRQPNEGEFDRSRPRQHLAVRRLPRHRGLPDQGPGVLRRGRRRRRCSSRSRSSTRSTRTAAGRSRSWRRKRRRFADVEFDLGRASGSYARDSGRDARSASGRPARRRRPPGRVPGDPRRGVARRGSTRAAGDVVGLAEPLRAAARPRRRRPRAPRARGRSRSSPGPGAMQLTRTPGASSTARILVRWTIAALVDVVDADARRRPADPADRRKVDDASRRARASTPARPAGSTRTRPGRSPGRSCPRRRARRRWCAPMTGFVAALFTSTSRAPSCSSVAATHAAAWSGSPALAANVATPCTGTGRVDRRRPPRRARPACGTTSITAAPPSAQATSRSPGRCPSTRR